MLSKAQQVFDAATPANGDAVAAYLFASNRLASAAVNSNESLYTIAALNDSAGVGITSTAGSGTYAGHTGIDVSLISPLTIETDMNGVYDVSTNPVPANVGNIFNTRGASPDDTTQVERETAATAASDAVVAANIHGADVNSFNMLFNGTTWDRMKGSSGSAWVAGAIADGVADSGSPVKVGSRAFSGALSAIDATGERADLLSDIYRRAMVTTAPQVANKLTSTTIGVAAAKIVATPMGGRTTVTLQNNGSHPIYIGVDDTVTADNTATGGILVPAHGGTWTQDCGDSIVWWAISDTAAQRLLVVELG